ncbi:hypothetical protein GF336_07195 [Candidatus Woesearchaeota archaeon]|nr:hypothetical protein [Candidatus Woesearchaeota archaeon]
MAKKQDNNQEQIGFHKGALATLAKEREEMQKILSVVEQLMQMHIKALKELGVDLEKMAKDVKKEAGTKKPKSKKSAGSMDELLG